MVWLFAYPCVRLYRGRVVNQNLLYGILCFIACHVFAWFGNSLQFVSEWWRDRPILTILLFSMPIGFSAYYGMRFTYEGMGTLWSARFVGYATSFFIFPVLTWWFLHESMFTAKTLACIALSLVILWVQITWK